MTNFSIDLMIVIVLIFIVFYLYKRYAFPFLLNYFMKGLHKKLHDKIKKKAFNEAFERFESNGDTPLEILEVGVGTGENFRLFPPNARITFLDKTDAFLPYLKESFEKDNRNSDDFKLIVAPGENMSMIESNSKDVVVHTFILCSVNDPNQVLKEIYRVLKPGGVCVFIEHSLDPKNGWRRIFQQLIDPIWSLFFECHFRPMNSILEAGKYNSLKVELFEQKKLVLTFSNPFIYGLGIKE